MKTEMNEQLTVREFLRNLWYRWEVVRVRVSLGKTMIMDMASERFRTHMQANCFRALRIAVWQEDWLIRRSTLPSWYWRLFR